MRENWRAIDGYQGFYEISNYGNVRSVDRIIARLSKYGKGFSQRWLGRSLTPLICCPKWGGYWAVSLSKDGIVSQNMIHILVAKAFIPNPENKPEVNHRDGIKFNNYVGNLEWMTCSENHRHCYAIGTRPIGKNNHLSKLP